MGYTHYFKQTKQISDLQWQAFKKDAEKLINAIQESGVILMSNDEINSFINDDRINLNGDESKDLECETFLLRKNNFKNDFCKTNRKPYDLIVCSLLLLADEVFADCYDIRSDGNFEEWKHAMEFNAKTIQKGFKLKLPKIKDIEEVQSFEILLTENFCNKQPIINKKNCI